MLTGSLPENNRERKATFSLASRYWMFDAHNFKDMQLFKCLKCQSDIVDFVEN